MRLILVAFFSLSCLLGGCKPKYKEDPPVDPTALQTAFASADAATKATVDSALSNINAAQYSMALNDLQKLYGQAGVTPDQQKTILGVKTVVMKKIDEAAKSTLPPAK